MVEQWQALGLTDEAQALAQGVLLGDKTAMSAEMIRTFRVAGMSHLLAVSGLHVGVIMSLLMAVLKPIGGVLAMLAPSRTTWHYAIGTGKRLMVISVIACYVWRIGAPPSAVRAALMLSLLLLAWIIHRQIAVWRSLLLAALLLLAWDPWAVCQVGFQLSFMAVAGILLFEPWLTDRTLPRMWRLLLLSVAAQWLTLPLVAYWFHQVPVLGWLQGLLVVPLVPVLVVALLLGTALPAWHLCAVVVNALTAWICWIAQWIGRLEDLLLGGHLYLYPEVWEVALAEVLLLAVVVYARLHYKQKREEI